MPLSSSTHLTLTKLFVMHLKAICNFKFNNLQHCWTAVECLACTSSYRRRSLELAVGSWPAGEQLPSQQVSTHSSNGRLPASMCLVSSAGRITQLYASGCLCFHLNRSEPAFIAARHATLCTHDLSSSQYFIQLKLPQSATSSCSVARRLKQQRNALHCCCYTAL